MLMVQRKYTQISELTRYALVAVIGDCSSNLLTASSVIVLSQIIKHLIFLIIVLSHTNLKPNSLSKSSPLRNEVWGISGDSLSHHSFSLFSWDHERVSTSLVQTRSGIRWMDLLFLQKTPFCSYHKNYYAIIL